MRQIITTYVVVVVLLALGFFGVGALAKAAELRDPMQPPAFALQKFRQARLSAKPTTTTKTDVKQKQKPLQLTREVYGDEFKQNGTGYIVLPARIQSRIFPVDYLNVSRKGESLMTVSSGQVRDSEGDNVDENLNSEPDPNALKSSSVNTRSEADFWTQLQATLTSKVDAGVFGSLDYVQLGIQATVSLDPP